MTPSYTLRLPDGRTYRVEFFASLEEAERPLAALRSHMKAISGRFLDLAIALDTEPPWPAPLLGRAHPSIKDEPR